MLYWVSFAVVSLALSHVFLRSFYGKKHLAWSYVEYVWCAVSFVGLAAATIQLTDKVASIDVQQKEVLISSKWSQLRLNIGSTIEVLNEGIENYTLDGKKPEPSRFYASPEARPSDEMLNDLKKLSMASGTATSVNMYRIYDSYFGSFCRGRFGNQPEATGFSTVEGSGDNFPEINIWLRDSYIGACQDSWTIQKLSREAFDEKRQSDARSSVYWYASWWSYFIAFGLALKFTRVTSEFVERRDEKRKALEALRAAAIDPPTDLVNAADSA